MANFKPAAQSQAQLQRQQQTNDVVSTIKKFESEIRLALPKHVDASRMTRIVITEVRKNPLLAECDRASLFGAIIQAAQLGLEPGSAMGQCYLIPHKIRDRWEVQFIVGYRGMIDLIERGGTVTIEAYAVYEKDEFSYALGLNQTLHHVPYFGSEDRGQVIAAYAIARYNNGRTKFRVLSRSDIDVARKSSKSANGSKPQYSPWNTNYADMAIKTAIRKLSKQLPFIIEMHRVAELEEIADSDQSQNLSVLYENPNNEDQFLLGDSNIEETDKTDKINESEGQIETSIS